MSTVKQSKDSTSKPIWLICILTDTSNLHSVMLYELTDLELPKLKCQSLHSVSVHFLLLELQYPRSGTL